MFLSALMLAGLLAVPATQAAAAGETVTRTINLLDLSETAADTTLSKENLTNWPAGMSVGDFDDYDGTRSVVELSDGTKALKLAFDKALAKAPSDRKLTTIENYDFKFQIPAAYRPYLNSVKLKLENHSNLFDNWKLNSPYFLLAFTDGTHYSKINDKTLGIDKVNYEYTLPVAGVAKVDRWGYADWANPNSAPKWTEEEKSGMTDVVLSVTVPYIDDLTTYMLIKSLELEVIGTAEELDAAERESLRASALITDFESDSNAFTAAEDGVFAASGTKVYKHYRNSGAPWEGDFRISLDSRVRFYDGISFYLYNPNEAKEL